MKKILGLDIGTNSIGGALIEVPDNFEDYGKDGRILWMGSRVIPVDGDMLMKFESGGLTETKAAARRRLRGIRRLKHRYKLRRTRLIKVLKTIGWLNSEFPEDFKELSKRDPDFKFSINKYLPFEKTTIEEATRLLGVENKKGKLAVSEDWIVYYLRKKALSEKISISELARIIYMMNQRRGFKSGRKDKKNDEEKTTDKWVEILTIDSVEEIVSDDIKAFKKGKPKKEFSIKAGNHSWKVTRFEKPDWIGKQYQFLITKTSKKDGQEDFKYDLPKEGDWEMMKTALEQDIKNSGLHVGEYFFNHLLHDKNYRIRQRIVDRSLYRLELEAIWNKQKQFHPELSSIERLKEISEMLYKVNAESQKKIQAGDLFSLFANDIIYYQRDLKSQKKLLSGCPFEKGRYKKDGREFYSGYKVAPRSCPEFQEFRILQDIHNIRIIEKEKTVDGRLLLDADVTKEFLDDEAIDRLVNLFDTSKGVTEKSIFKAINKDLLKLETHRINLFANRKELKGNETKHLFREVFGKCGYDGTHLIEDKDTLYRLWHIIYSINSSDSEVAEKGIRNALTNPKLDLQLPENVVTVLSQLHELDKQYASFSSKAIRKILPLMRNKSLWHADAIDENTKERIGMLIAGAFENDEDIKTLEKINNHFAEFGKKVSELEFKDFYGLPVWLASYIVYGRHSQSESVNKYETFTDIDVMSLIPNNSLRNPIVEQVVRESLFYVRDIWERFGQPDEIHVELARELKKNTEERKKLSENVNKNFYDKERVKNILNELRQGVLDFDVSPNPNSPMDIEKFRIYESCSGKSFSDFEKEMRDASSGWKFSNSDIRSYALWLEQKCISPYTGKVIPLSKLFTDEYQVEHIIPRSRLKYDSPENLVICESVVNSKKGSFLAMELIEQFGGREYKESGINFKLLSADEYELHCKKIFARNRNKLRNLLRTDIPNDFVTRQLNDTRYITRKIAELLQPVAKDKYGIVFTSGAITSELKQSWELNLVWKQILLPRFQRLEKILDTKLILPDEEREGNFHLYPPDPKVDIKRVDHRHHALDALIIAATTREHIKYLNSLNRVDNEQELREVKKRLVKRKIREFLPPWETFASDCKESVEKIIVTFKTNNKILSKPFNKYFKWELVNGKWTKVIKKQKSNKKWLAVRKSLFKQPQGTIFLKQVKEKSLKVAVRLELDRFSNDYKNAGKTQSYVYDQEVREQLKLIIKNYGGNEKEVLNHLKKNPLSRSDSSVVNKVAVAEFDRVATKKVRIDKSFTKKKIESIPYAHKSRIAKLLLAHLEDYGGDPAEAFEGEGFEKLKLKNGGRPLEKVTLYEEKAEMEIIDSKLLETDKGGNVYFVVYKDPNGNTVEMETVSVYKATKRILSGEPVAEEKEDLKSIILSPNDLVMVVENGDLENARSLILNVSDLSRLVYKVVSFTGAVLYLVPQFIATSLVSDEKELGWNNKSEQSWDGVFIKRNFVKLDVSRLGEIKIAND